MELVHIPTDTMQMNACVLHAFTYTGARLRGSHGLAALQDIASDLTPFA